MSEENINQELEKEFEDALAELIAYNASVPKSEQILVDLDTGIIRKRTIRKINKVPERNDPCPCESGKKYKKCCMNKQEIYNYGQ